ncbi:DNA repair and recombination protein RAD54B-like isoform X2 [Pseudomyrmex gracilis]|uniref:DNA repair and recombination protein RAD54B-like isoform X2 n=1 Tax=Pseudomyrmex gracilis TaxID=219809 RepID=UPI000994AD11|nr:DNA repair and recombination protein RAD54B-like isoform X2 [Pseudomyrmex gracilis]
MNRHKPVRGFTSPLIAQPRSDIKKNEVFANVTKTPVDLTNSQSKSFRSNSQILNLFVTSKEECDTDNTEVKNKSSKKLNASVCVTNVSAADSLETGTKNVFNVVYGKVTSKKHKTWEGDGLLEVTGKSAVLKDLDGKIMGRTTVTSSDVAEGFKLIIGNKEIEIIDRASQELSVVKKIPEKIIEKPSQTKFKALVSLKEQDATIHKEKTSTVDLPQSDTKIIFNVTYGKITSKKHQTWDDDGLLENLNGNVIGKTKLNPSNIVKGFRLIIGNKQIEIVDQVSQELCVSKKSPEKEEVKEPLAKKFKLSTTHTFMPLLSSSKRLILNCEPLVMPHVNLVRESQEDSEKEHEVSVDFCLATKLREHQRHGIVFLYECLMGLRLPNYFGTILADEMGLGKTIQCITLIWTMLKKGPYGKPIVKRVLIITPSSLCDNWNKEFVKWLGSHRIFPYVVDGKNKPKDFTKNPGNSVMIISYEMFSRCHTEISEITFDLIVCDEGHRLKNSNVKAAKLLHEMECKRRIILTGTPIQNDLKEFYALVDFVNPGILGTSVEYKSYYEDPIVASQCPRADEEILSLGNERATELHERTKVFILRRTQETINKYLPCKYEIVLFCCLSNKQQYLYTRIIDAWFDKICIDKSNNHLSVITALKKVCNHPNLLINENENTLQDILPNEMQIKRDETFADYCGKITIVRTLMRNLKKTDEKLVLVSYYTRTLDLLETVCNMEKLKFLRLDGSTSNSTRSKVIEQFNMRTNDDKVFLLSGKAGGVGLNLPGASRLILFDSDWNPASDVQAMARIWRDGQKKDVYIYRLLTTGTIEEKIYQRQISKAGLSESVVDLNHLGSLKLSTSELKDLFTLTTDTVSLTHDLMNCSCSGKNNEHISSENLNNENTESQFVQKPSRHNLTINQLLRWHHYKQPIPSDIMQNVLLEEANEKITFMFINSTR